MLRRMGKHIGCKLTILPHTWKKYLEKMYQVCFVRRFNFVVVYNDLSQYKREGGRERESCQPR